MTRASVAVGRKALFKDIVEPMEQWQVSALPVLEGDGRVIGVVSEADLLPKKEFRDSDPDRFTQERRLSDPAKAGAVSAGELMNTPAVTVTVHADADATLAEAARIMAVRHVKRLPSSTPRAPPGNERALVPSTGSPRCSLPSGTPWVGYDEPPGPSGSPHWQ